MLQGIINFVLYKHPLFSPMQKRATEFISMLSSLQENEINNKQKELFNHRKTVVFKVNIETLSFGFEVPGEFKIIDVFDLVFRKCQRNGTLYCRKLEINENLMLGFVEAFIWREPNIMTLNLA